MKRSLLLISLPFFLIISQSVGQTKIIEVGDEWYYYDLKVPPPNGWEKNITPSDTWKVGNSPLGYGDSVVKTSISFGNDPKNKHITKYFKKTFKIEDPFKYLVYKLNVQRDGGIVIYLNGEEIMRSNMPKGKITNTTKATSLIVTDKVESNYYTHLLYPENLITGVNTLSVSVHQGSLDSADCIFSLELIGENNPEILPILLKEHSFRNQNLNLKLIELNNKLELGKKDLQIRFLEKSKANLKIGLYSFCFLFLSALITIFYLFYSKNKERTKIKKKLKKTKAAVLNKNRELMSISLTKIQNQQFLKEIKEILKKGTHKENTEIRNIIRQINYIIEHDDDQIDLLKHFNSVHIGFLDKLSKLHPLLTESEQRHCIYIKLHIQTKEIAQILHIDPKSVQASRYRIKKKMNLKEGVDLRSYLHKI